MISRRGDPAIKSGNATNTLKVIAKGSSFQFFINGALIGAAEEKTFAEGELALFVSTGDDGLGHATFRNLTVW